LALGGKISSTIFFKQFMEIYCEENFAEIYFGNNDCAI
jgi:hypothetical protein